MNSGGFTFTGQLSEFNYPSSSHCRLNRSLAAFYLISSSFHFGLSSSVAYQEIVIGNALKNFETEAAILFEELCFTFLLRDRGRNSIIVRSMKDCMHENRAFLVGAIKNAFALCLIYCVLLSFYLRTCSSALPQDCDKVLYEVCLRFSGTCIL